MKRQVCARFVELCRKMGLLTTASVAIDGSKFKAVNNRDRNFTNGKVERRRQQLEESAARYLSQLDTIDHQLPSEAARNQDDASRAEARDAAGRDEEARAHEKRMRLLQADGGALQFECPAFPLGIEVTREPVAFIA